MLTLDMQGYQTCWEPPVLAVPAKQQYEPQDFSGAHAECPRLAEPKLPRPSRLPTVDEFGVIVVLDVKKVKDADQVSWSLLKLPRPGNNIPGSGPDGSSCPQPNFSRDFRCVQSRLGVVGRFAREARCFRPGKVFHDRVCKEAWGAGMRGFSSS